jgi:hypothetical protein
MDLQKGMVVKVIAGRKLPKGSEVVILGVYNQLDYTSRRMYDAGQTWVSKYDKNYETVLFVKDLKTQQTKYLQYYQVAKIV